MKIITFFLVLLSANLFAQNISQSEISSASNTYVESNVNFSYTIGGVFSGTVSNGKSLTQGFHQPEIIKLDENTSAKDLKLQIYPNPVIETLTIRFYIENEQKIQTKIYDISGKLVKQFFSSFYENENSKIIKLKLNDLEQGNYLISLTGKEKIISFKILKK